MRSTPANEIDLRTSRRIQPVEPIDLRDLPLVERVDAFLRPAGVERVSLGTHRARRSGRTVEGLAHPN